MNKGPENLEVFKKQYEGALTQWPQVVDIINELISYRESIKRAIEVMDLEGNYGMDIEDATRNLMQAYICNKENSRRLEQILENKGHLD